VIAKKNKKTASAEAGAVSKFALLREGFKDPFFWSKWLVVVAFLLVVLIFGALSPEAFLTTYNLNNILVASAIPAIIVVGQTFTVATAGIDLSVSSIMTFGAVCFGLAFTNGLASLSMHNIFDFSGHVVRSYEWINNSKASN